MTEEKPPQAEIEKKLILIKRITGNEANETMKSVRRNGHDLCSHRSPVNVAACASAPADIFDTARSACTSKKTHTQTHS